MAPKSRQPQRSTRYVLLLAVFVVFLVGVGARLVYLQLVAGPAYAAMAHDQRSREMDVPARRGSIYDREGEPLAVSMEARDVYAVPDAVVDKQAAATAVAGVLGGTAEEYLGKLNKDAPFVYLARKVDVERADALKQLDLVGIGFQEDARRVYPSNELACQILGFVGIDDVGLAGVEQYYDSVLAGTPGKVIAEKGTRGIPIPGGVSVQEDAVDGENIVLTIDKDIQYQAHVELQAAVEKWGAKGGSVVVMDPDTGAILAMASTPTFDPNKFATADAKAFRNRPIVDTYEPGSTIKSLTAAAVIEEKMFTPTSAFVLPPTLKVGGRTIHESHPRGQVTWSLTDIVTNSSNVGAVKLGIALGEDRLYDYFSRFGLTEKTGVDFPGEAMGWLPPPAQWSASSIGNIPFGQGVSVTPMQLARALASIANGGELVTPHFLQALPDSPDKTLVWPKKQAISAETAAEMRGVLSAVVTEGTGSGARVTGYSVAGKTGTAQKARTDGQAGYAQGKYIASFSGFVPAEDPAVLIVVMIDEPSNSIFGGTVAAPTFSRLSAYCMEHLKIPPTTTKTSSTDASHTADDAVTGEPQSDKD
ncbi:MAG: penicillin-binding protein 2 [Actinobacteria bacterium]|nr:MAG: penicillin-binding protein 2 [Actinomycetota bacterium]